MPVREESARFFPRSFKKVARQVGRSDDEHRDVETHPLAIAEAASARLTDLAAQQVQRSATNSCCCALAPPTGVSEIPAAKNSRDTRKDTELRAGSRPVSTGQLCKMNPDDETRTIIATRYR